MRRNINLEFGNISKNVGVVIFANCVLGLIAFIAYQEDWQKEKRDSLQSLSRISTLPRTNMIVSSSGGARSGQIVSMTSSPQVSSGASSMEIVPLANKPTLEKKATVYAKVVKDLNNARERGLPFKVRLSCVLFQ